MIYMEYMTEELMVKEGMMLWMWLCLIDCQRFSTLIVIDPEYFNNAYEWNARELRVGEIVRFECDVQGDHSGCHKRPVDFNGHHVCDFPQLSQT